MKKADSKTKEKPNIKSDFIQFFIAEAGSSKIKSAQFEEVSASSSSSESNDFREQDDDEVEEKGIKTFQFWSGIKFPKDAPKVSNDEVEWKVSCPFSFGFNSLGRDNIMYIDGIICKAFGCLLIFNNKIYTKHNKKITTLAFNAKSSELLSATQSPFPEFFLWKYHSETKFLEFKRRFVVGSSSEDIYSISFFQENYVVCVDMFRLHKSSTLHCFNLEDGMKISSIKVGKFYDIELLNAHQQKDIVQDRLFYSNDEGLWEVMSEFQQGKTTFKTSKIHGSDNLCCLLPFYDEKDLEIIYGDKEGNIKLVDSKETVKAHDGWIFQLKTHKHQEKQYFFALGAMDLKLSVIEYAKKKIKVVKKIQLGGYGRSIEIEKDILLIGKRDGDYEELSVTQLIEQKSDDKIKSKKTQSLKCFENKDKKREYFIEVGRGKADPKLASDKELQYPTKRYLYGHSRSKQVNFLTIGNKSVLSVDSYSLRYYAQALDANGSIIAYVYYVEKEDQNMLTMSEDLKKTTLSKTITKTDKKIQKMVLIVEDTANKNLLAKIPIEVPSSNKSPSTQVNLKFTQSGNNLAVTDPSGNLFLLTKNSKNQFRQELTKSDKQTHKEPIQEITWSKDQKFIKTISQTELQYWEVASKGNTETKLISTKAGQITEVAWVSISKFGWQTKNVWESTDLVGDIYKFWSQEHTQIEIVETKSKKEIEGVKRNVIGCVRNDGSLRIYNHPAKGAKRQEIKINNQRFEVHPYSESCERFCFFVVIEGMIALIQLDQ